jgi:hypothetical protein
MVNPDFSSHKAPVCRRNNPKLFQQVSCHQGDISLALQELPSQKPAAKVRPLFAGKLFVSECAS